MPRPRLAWFSPLPPTRSGISAYTAELLPSLGLDHEIDIYAEGETVDALTTAVATSPEATRGPSLPPAGARTVRSAHAFAPAHSQRPYDLIVYQLGNAACHDYMWPYLVRYPGLVVLHDAAVHHSRARALLTRRRVQDYRDEFLYAHPGAPADLAEFAVAGFAGSPYYLWPHVRIPLERARLAAVHAPPLAEALRADYPHVDVRTIRMGVPAVAADGDGVRNRPGPVFACYGLITPEKRIEQVLRAFAEAVRVTPEARLLLVGQTTAHYAVEKEIERVGLGRHVTITGYVPDADLPRWLTTADVCLCLRWPTARETSASWLRCLAAGKPTVITDLVHTTDVPVLDPRNWTLAHARRDAAAPGRSDDPRDAVAVAIDILDEDHSLGLAMQRLATDAPLRRLLGQNGHAWWASRHRLEHMAEDYREVISEAVARPDPPVPHDLPRHLLDDGTGTLRTIADEFGLGTGQIDVGA